MALPVQVMVRMDAEMAAWLDAEAERTERTRAQVVRYYLRRVKAGAETAATRGGANA